MIPASGNTSFPGKMIEYPMKTGTNKIAVTHTSDRPARIGQSSPIYTSRSLNLFLINSDIASANGESDCINNLEIIGNNAKAVATWTAKFKEPETPYAAANPRPNEPDG